MLFAREAAIWQHADALSVTGRGQVGEERVGVGRKPGQEGPSRLEMVKVWLLDPRSLLALRRRVAEVRLTRRSLLAAGMAVWLLYAALVWQFGGRRLDDCTSLACRALLGGLPFGPGDAAPPAAAAGPSTPAPPVGGGGLAPGTPPSTSLGATTTTTTLLLPVFILVPSTTGVPPPTAGETTTTLVTPADPGSSTTTTTTVPECQPKKNGKCKPKQHPKAWHWWWPRHLANFRGGW